MKKWLLVGVMLLVSLLVVGCGIPQEDYNAVVDERDTAQAEVASLQSKLSKMQSDLSTAESNLAEAQSQIESLESDLDEATRAKYEELESEYSELNTKYNELKADYDELSVKYNTLIEGTAGISEKDVEQAIFEVINQDRQNNGLNELEWTDSIYWWAKEHSDYMAARKRLELSDYSYWQDIFRAAGYSTVDRIANAALIIWKESPTYETNFLDGDANYGVVAVSKSGEIFYITYFAHMSK